jgi:hypothetical protein
VQQHCTIFLLNFVYPRLSALEQAEIKLPQQKNTILGFSRVPAICASNRSDHRLQSYILFRDVSVLLAEEAFQLPQLYLSL